MIDWLSTPMYSPACLLGLVVGIHLMIEGFPEAVRTVRSWLHKTERENNER